MNRSTLARGTHLLLLLATALAFGACDDVSSPSSPVADTVEEASPFAVMTRNVYLGGDTGPVFEADFSDPVAVIEAAGTVWAQVQASAIPDRAVAIVDEIDEARPHVVSLQEVFRFESTAGVVIDWLDELEAEIAARGLPYHVAAVQDNTAALLPVSEIELVEFIDRIAVLVRDDVTQTGLAQGNYAAEFLLAEADPPIGDVVLKRGWIRLSTDFGGGAWHVVATHLETQGIRPIHDAQADELQGSVAAGLDGVTIIAGDLNSDANAVEGDPSWTPTYGKLVEAGFVDAWLKAPESLTEDGFTCCQAPDLLNASSQLDERIDFVLIRPSNNPADDGNLPGSVMADIVGEEEGDRLPSGLWPADHAGLVTDMRLPEALFNP